MEKEWQEDCVPILGISKEYGSSFLGPNAKTLYTEAIKINKIQDVVLIEKEYLKDLREQVYSTSEVIHRQKIYSVYDIIDEAINGSYNCLRIIAELLYDGYYFPKNKKHALSMLESLSACGFHLAKYSLYWIYYDEGRGKEKFYLIEEMVEDGFLPAIVHKADFLNRGEFLDKNQSQAIKLWQMAAKGGSRVAMNRLAKIYRASKNPLTVARGYYLRCLFIASIVYSNLREIENEKTLI